MYLVARNHRPGEGAISEDSIARDTVRSDGPVDDRQIGNRTDRAKSGPDEGGKHKTGHSGVRVAVHHDD